MDAQNKIQNKYKDRIRELKAGLGSKLIILTHHYQNKEIVELGDYVGDSFGLARRAAADTSAEYIVFCGVHFMAESAAILARPGQSVQIPDVEAGCWMADMADPFIVERTWQELSDFFGPESMLPISYMNSEAEIKAFCGRNQGLICTSSNAAKAFSRALEQRERIFFLPDQYLGLNTADKLGIPREEIVVWDPGLPLGGNSSENLAKSRIVLWKGHCLVHTRFSQEQIEEVRKSRPGAKIVVHPECTPEVVALADAAGSTDFMIKYVENSSPGEEVVIGTEFNLIHRLQTQYRDRTILPLSRSICPNMAKIDLQKLCHTLESPGRTNVVTVDKDLKEQAKLALERMLALSS
ncbi:MAG: quinolinate synthase NadA [Desulfohalobiaceae bacterium]|nr:quinolinate synthase NadA [Desulfohalobiaceae bacterium]